MKQRLGAARVGIVGTGFISTGLDRSLGRTLDFSVSKVLTRREPGSVAGFPQEVLTRSVAELIAHSDIVVECSGDAIHATDVIQSAVDAGLKVVTMNSEFHVTAGSHFARAGVYVSEADGDQPGCLARLKQEVEGMGFEPLAYLNLKGFLNHTPTPEDMAYWSARQDLSLSSTISFTDGTKVEIERVLVANGLGANIAGPEISGVTVDSLDALDLYVDAARESGAPISDYVLCNGAPPGVLIVAGNPVADLFPGYLPWARLRTRDNRAYVLVRPYHLTFLEIVQTLRRTVAGEGMLLTNSTNPRFTVAAIAKRRIGRGTIIENGVGSFDVRGVGVPFAGHLDAVPICLLKNVRVTEDIEPGELLRFGQVELVGSLAGSIYNSLLADIRQANGDCRLVTCTAEKPSCPSHW